MRKEDCTHPPRSLAAAPALAVKGEAWQEPSREAENAAPPPAVSGLSLRSNFAWILSGNVVYAACQWGVIVALAKLGSTSMVGQFALGLAVATPVLMLSNLNLRAAQATDARRFYSFSEYLQLRGVMTVVALAVIAGIARFAHNEPKTALVIVAVAVAKGIESLSDIYYGLFQLNDRLDYTGKSMMLRGGLSLAALTAGLYVTHDVFWACVTLSLAWLTALLFFDLPRGRLVAAYEQQPAPSNRTKRQQKRRLELFQRQWDLMRLALPLGIVTTLLSVNLNMPRYFIQLHLGEHQLGIFSALAYATVAITLVTDSLGHSALPCLSRLYAQRHMAKFRLLLLQLSAIGCVLGLGGLVVAQMFGTRILSSFYNAEYAASNRVFIVLMIATAIHCVSGMLTSGILSAREFSVQVPILAIVVASNAWACLRFVPEFGLMGGAMAMVVGAVVRLGLTVGVVAHLVSAQPKIVGEPGSRHCLQDWKAAI